MLTPEQTRIKGLADAIIALMQIPDEQDAADCASPLVKELSMCVENMSRSAIQLNQNQASSI